MCVLQAAVSLLLASGAQASQSTAITVAIRASGCGATPSNAQVVEALRLELQSDGITRVRNVPDDQDADMTVDRHCVGLAQQVTLTIRTPAEGARVSRTLSLTDVPSALRARSIALAGAELLRSARASGDPPTPQDDAPAAESGTATAAPSGSTAAGDARETAAGERATDLPVADGPDARAADASTERGTRLRESSLAGLPVLSLGLGPALRVLGKPYLALYGGEISLHWQRIGIVGAGLWGAQSDSLGTAHFMWLDGSIALSVLRVLWQRWSLSGDVRGALGVVHADASATDLAIAVSATNMVWSAAAQLTLAYLLGSRWLLRLSLQTGYAAGPRFTADHRTLTAIAGPFIGIGLSTALALGK